MYGVYISQLLHFTRACDRYSDFLARHKRLVRTLLDQGFRYGLLCRKFKQFYQSHHSLIQRYSHSVAQHLREGVDSQVRWWHIRILLVVAAVTGTDRLSIYPFAGVPLAFSSFLYFIFIFLILTSVLLIFKLFFHLFSSSFFLLSFLSFLFFSFLLSLFFIFLFFYFFFNRCLFNSLSPEYARFCNVYR